MITKGVLRVVCVALLFVAGCFRAATGGGYPAEKISVPQAAEQYNTAPQPDGAVGGKGVEQLRAEVAAALAERGEKAEADGALAATASFALNELNQGRPLQLAALEAASRRYGFAGILISTSGFDNEHRGLWREQLEATARNMPITRYGVSMSPSGNTAAVVYGAAEVEFEPIPRLLEPGKGVTLKGRVGERFTFCHVYLTKPDGKVDERNIKDRAFDVTFPLTERGKYQLEVMGDGKTGPVVVSNVPLYVGIPEPAVTSLAGKVVDAEQAEARMLELLNEERKKAGLGTVVADAELREIALAHSEDMVSNDFFGHVSPKTGTPEDRIRRSGALVSIAGENVAAAATPEGAHEGLMGSPGHRANMLRLEFTHVGIGAEESPMGITVTMVLGRRPAPSAVPTSVDQVVAAVTDMRAKQNLPKLAMDPIYRAAAQAGADEYADGDSPEDANKAIQSTLNREVQRLRSSRAGGCTLYLEVLELIQLGDVRPLFQPGIKKIGVGARTHKDDKGTRLSTVFLLEGAPCK